MHKVSILNLNTPDKIKGFGIGGNNKVNSSSWILNKWHSNSEDNK